MERYEKIFLQESSLSRIVSHILSHDTGTISAYRSEFVHKDNQKRNASLEMKLMSLGYRLTDVQGVYIENFKKENQIEVKEHVFFAVDWKDKGNLREDLFNLGEEFNQDSVLFIPKGGKTSYLTGTNHTGFPGYKVVKEYPILKLGKDDYEFLTRVNGRPFYFKKISESMNEKYCGSAMSLGYATVEAKRDWRTIKI